jgi:P-type Cu+ transporter
MKKLDSKIFQEKEEGQQRIDSSTGNSDTIACDCCTNELPSSQPIKTRKEKENESYDGMGQENADKQNKQLLSDKLLIVIGLTLTIPVALLELFLPHSITTGFIMLALATPVQILLGRPFYYRFFKAVKHRKRFTPDTLVVLSTSVAYLYSLFTLLFTGSQVQFFEASSSVLTIFTIGEYLERRVLKTTTESLKNLLALKPKTAVVIRDGKGEVINSDAIIIGDIVIVKPGDKIAADGIIVNGESSIDESMISGESIPLDKRIGDRVTGGTMNRNGYLQFRAINVGSHTVLASIIDMVKKARISKAPVQRIADRAVQYFIPIVLSIAVGSALYWLVAAHQPLSFAVTVFATVLVVSCPCALGIATPMVISLGIDKAAREGVLIKGGEYLEKLASVNTIVFDKTGTLTKGKPEVTDIIANNGYSEFQILQLASSAENKSEHPIAHAVVRKAAERSIPLLEISEFNSIAGHGIFAIYQQKRIFVGNSRSHCSITKRIPENLQSKITYLESEGKTVITICLDDNLVGLIAIADTLRENASDMINEIKRMKTDIILMSGDNERTAKAIAKKLYIHKALAQVSPETKAQEIKKIQDQGKVVAMIGDGINDAPALTQANIGIAIGSGTDVAISSGHIILMKSDLYHILYALRLSEYSLKKIKQNLAMSFAYNAISISIAAGLLFSVTNSLILTPALAALGWIISDTLVFSNSLLVRKFNLLMKR